MNTSPPPAHGSRESGLPAALARVLDQVKRRQLLLTLAEFPVVLVAAIAIAWSCQALADRVFELSWAVRFVLLVIDGIDGSTDDAGTGKIPLKVPPGKRVWRHRFTWNLGLLVPAVTTGYSIGFWLEATDNNGVAPATGRSAEYTIRVIS